MQKQPKHYRQGDVLIIENSIPNSAIKQEKESRIVLEYGEVTNHAHAIREPEAGEMFLEGTRKFLEICFATSVQHEEHKAIPLTPGTYEVRRQCTWSALEQMAQVVRD